MGSILRDWPPRLRFFCMIVLLGAFLWLIWPAKSDGQELPTPIRETPDGIHGWIMIKATGRHAWTKRDRLVDSDGEQTTTFDATIRVRLKRAQPASPAFRLLWDPKPEVVTSRLGGGGKWRVVSTNEQTTSTWTNVGGEITSLRDHVYLTLDNRGNKWSYKLQGVAHLLPPIRGRSTGTTTSTSREGTRSESFENALDFDLYLGKHHAGDFTAPDEVAQKLAGDIDPAAGMIQGSATFADTQDYKEPDGTLRNVQSRTVITWAMATAREPVTITIVNPEPDSEYVFGTGGPGKLVIKAEAKVEPATYAKEVVWEVEDIQGSRKTIKPAKGPVVTITFDKLPEKNDQFGPKKISAKVRGKQDQVTVNVFFPKDGKDNPGKKYPNWFYYWSQRQGPVPGLEHFVFDVNRDHGEYDCERDRLVIGRRDADALKASILELVPVQIAGKGMCTPARIESPATEGIDSVARVVAHELAHQRLMQGTNCGKNMAKDRDRDGVPDDEERRSLYCLDPMTDDTHGLRAKVTGGMADDNEILAIAAEGMVKADHSKDWACPGSQCKAGK